MAMLARAVLSVLAVQVFCRRASTLLRRRQTINQD
jgi:hypothetical protein